MGNVRPGTDCIGQNTDALSAATASRVDEADADRHAPAVLAEETAARVWYLDFQDKGCDSAARAQRFLHTRLFCASWGHVRWLANVGDATVTALFCVD
jgi:hypothetical protein